MALEKDGVTPDLLAMKAAQYAEAKGANDPKYIKMPQYWLNDECWLEDPQPPKPKAAKGKRKREKANVTGEAKPKTETKAKTKVKTKAKTNAKTKAKTKTKTKTKTKANAKTKADAKAKAELADFSANVRRYCDYLDITPKDISLAMGLPASLIKRVCAGAELINNKEKIKDWVKSLLIEAVQHRDPDEKLTVEWLRGWYDLMIKDEPQKRYEWMAPHRYEPPRRNHP